jgi:CHAD domain-containing protein
VEKKITFVLPPSISFQKLFYKINHRCTIQFDSLKKSEVFIFDTFDWRLFFEGLFFLKDEKSYSMLSSENDVVEQLNYPIPKTPKFWWEFPEGNFKKKLRSILGVRALLEKAGIKLVIRWYCVLNEDKKIVLKFSFDQAQIPGTLPKRLFIVLHPLRGYSKESRRFQKLLLDLGCRAELKNYYYFMLKTAGFFQDLYSSKLIINLLSSMTTQNASILIFNRLLKIIYENIDGIKADIDSEFLHDFRVSVRRTRSALSQFKGVFPDKDTYRFKRAFSFLGKVTNRLRDIDVYLQKKREYNSMLPENLQPGLIPLFHTLEKQRKIEHQKLVKTFDSPKFNKILEDWKGYISGNNQKKGAKNSHQPIAITAKKIILKRYRMLLSIGGKIDNNTPEKEFHVLRIEGKKLRYLLEFFSSLFDETQIERLVKELKNLQDNLGEFNDLTVQQNFLSEYLTEHSQKMKNSPEIAAAIGGLIVHLNQRQLEVKKSFQTIFEKFNHPKYNKIYLTMFSQKDK